MSEDHPAPSAPDRPPRRPYEKPAVSWEDDLDRRPGLIAVCNKSKPLTDCDSGSLQS